MTVRVSYSRRAAAEIAEITAYLAEHSEAAARRFESMRKRAERQLSEFPNSGAPGPVPGTRRLGVGDYIVSYRRRGGGVEIFAVRRARPLECAAVISRVEAARSCPAIRSGSARPPAGIA